MPTYIKKEHDKRKQLKFCFSTNYFSFMHLFLNYGGGVLCNNAHTHQLQSTKLSVERCARRATAQYAVAAFKFRMLRVYLHQKCY